MTMAFRLVAAIGLLSELSQVIANLEAEYRRGWKTMKVTELLAMLAQCRQVQAKIDTELHAGGRTMENKIKAERKPLVARLEQLGFTQLSTTSVIAVLHQRFNFIREENRGYNFGFDKRHNLRPASSNDSCPRSIFWARFLLHCFMLISQAESPPSGGEK